jgi:hypothetical protein
MCHVSEFNSLMEHHKATEQSLKIAEARCQALEAQLKEALEDLDDFRAMLTPTADPSSPGRLVLNAYGRRCFDEGRAALSAPSQESNKC